MERVVIFGGSFDPPTNAHVALIGELSARFDRVIVVPSRVSPFKTDVKALDGKERMELLASCRFPSNVEISDCEIASEGVSYTYLTVEKYKKIYPELYFCVGTDMLYTLDKWKNAGYLAENVIFYVVKRPFYDVSAEHIERLEKFGFKFESAPFVGEDGSSSEVKIAVAFDRVSDAVPAKIAEYITENSLYRAYCPITALYGKYGLKQTRIEHTHRVAKKEVVMARIHSLDADKAIRAALWHDIGKYVSLERAKQLGLSLDEAAQECPEAVLHSFVGEAIARREGEKDEEVLGAVRNHTCGKRNMSPLEMLIYLADMTEEGRAFEGVDEIRRAQSRSLEEGMRAALEHTVSYLRGKDRNIYSPTLEAYDYYCKK